MPLKSRLGLAIVFRLDAGLARRCFEHRFGNFGKRPQAQRAGREGHLHLHVRRARECHRARQTDASASRRPTPARPRWPCRRSLRADDGDGFYVRPQRQHAVIVLEQNRAGLDNLRRGGAPRRTSRCPGPSGSRDCRTRRCGRRASGAARSYRRYGLSGTTPSSTPCAGSSRRRKLPRPACPPPARGAIVPLSSPARKAGMMVRCASGKSGTTVPSKPHSFLRMPRVCGFSQA